MSLDLNPSYAIPEEIGPLLDHFSDISDVVRPTGKEEAIRNLLIKKALERGLSYRIDVRGNLLIDVPATPGFEDKMRVYLQGHMDMVTLDGDHNVARKAKVTDDGWIEANDMTLGMDDGFALAAAFALVDDKDLKHGPMTFVFTVHEEEPPMGASELDPSVFPTEEAILINLDSERGAKYLCKGCAASSTITGTFPIETREDIPDNYEIFSLKIDGLPGGHSGLDIHEQRGNGLLQINDVLLALVQSEVDIRLIKLEGGERRNKIASGGYCEFAIPQDKVDQSRDLISNKLAEWKSGKNPLISGQYAQNVSLDSQPLEEIEEDIQVLNSKVRKRLLDLLADLPHGPIVLGETGRVELSNNVAKLEPVDRNLKLTLMTRDADESRLVDKVREIITILETAGLYNIEKTKPVGAWLEPETSLAIKIAQAACLEVLKQDPIVFPEHCGLETPWVLQAIRQNTPNITAVSVGPLIENAHTRSERSYIPSIKESYLLVRRMVEMVGEGVSDQIVYF